MVSVVITPAEAYTSVTRTLTRAQREALKPQLTVILEAMKLSDQVALMPEIRTGRPPTGGPDDRSWSILTPHGDVLHATLPEACKIFNIKEGSARALTSKDTVFEKQLDGETWKLARDRQHAAAEGPSPMLTEYLEYPPCKGRRRL